MINLGKIFTIKIIVNAYKVSIEVHKKYYNPKRKLFKIWEQVISKNKKKSTS